MCKKKEGKVKGRERIERREGEEEERGNMGNEKEGKGRGRERIERRAKKKRGERTGMKREE